jgi:hypothetical protein
MISFWLTIEMGFLEEARKMLVIDPELLNGVLVNLRENGESLQRE